MRNHKFRVVFLAALCNLSVASLLDAEIEEALCLSSHWVCID